MSRAPPRTFICLQGRLRTAPRRPFHTSPHLSAAPKPSIDTKHIRLNPDLHAENCVSRNYNKQSAYPARIVSLFKQWHAYQHEAKKMREHNNRVKQLLGASSATLDTSVIEWILKSEDATRLAGKIENLSPEEKRALVLKEAKYLKEKISTIKEDEARIMSEIDTLAASIPNLTSDETPRGDEPKLLGYINDHPEPDPSASGRVWRSHVDLGKELQLLDFAGAATTTGWGYYYLLNEAAMLEQALVQYALSLARKAGWGVVAPPSTVYSHIAAACGFQPRDQNGEQQVYNIQQNARDVGVKPELSLAGTAEIPLAGMKADRVLEEEDLPMKRVGVSRCYRAEAGARGVGTKGLYRVHEFTKVELFAWTMPSNDASTSIFNEMVSLQKTILSSLGLHCRILEMPSTDLGASATRKIDIEAFFPSRRNRDEGWGEVTSVSMCTDYQSRRLATTVIPKASGGSIAYPYTVNGTALAVPRVLAAILENGWDESKGQVMIPQCLWPWMDGITTIGPKDRAR